MHAPLQRLPVRFVCYQPYVINERALRKRQEEGRRVFLRLSPGWSEARISSSQQLICLQKYYGQMLYRKVISGSEKLLSGLDLLLKQNFPSLSRKDTDKKFSIIFCMNEYHQRKNTL